MGTPQTRSTVKRSVDSTFGQLMLNMSFAMKTIQKKDLAIPAFASIFMTMMLGVPTPAFAAVAAVVAPAAPSAMTKLLKMFSALVPQLFSPSLLFIQLMLLRQESKLLRARERTLEWAQLSLRLWSRREQVLSTRVSVQLG